MWRSRAGAAAVAGILVAVLAGCSSSGTPAGQPSGGGSTSGSAAADGVAGPAPYLLARTAVQAAGSSATVVGPRRGGTLTVELPSGAIATLTFATGAVQARTRMTMTAFTADGVEGVQLDPAGTWLAVPATLVFTNTGKTAAIRVGNAHDGSSAFAAPATDSAGAIIIVRLRPVLLLDPAAGPLPPAATAASGVTTDAEQGGDPIDGRAADEEAGEADDPDGTTGGEAAAQEAARRVEQLAPECGPDLPQAAAQALEAWRTAGSLGAPPTACAVLQASVLAQTVVEFTGAGMQPYQETVRATGSGTSIDQVADIDMPAQREVSGIAQLVSFMATTMEWGVAKAVGEDWPEPNDRRCTMGTVPQGSVRLESVPLPDSRLRVTLTPKHGTYPVDCGEWGTMDMDVTVWDMLRDLLGIGEGQPIVVTTTATEHVQHVMSSLTSYQGGTVRHGADGSVTVREDQLVMHGVLDLDLRYEPAT
ncbi:MAG: hypothetical protein Q8M17_03220 [Actinomycetota bacterium]|nr:hypothetical protein [Actinomycetota bacterium]